MENIEDSIFIIMVHEIFIISSMAYYPSMIKFRYNLLLVNQLTLHKEKCVSKYCMLHL